MKAPRGLSRPTQSARRSIRAYSNEVFAGYERRAGRAYRDVIKSGRRRDDLTSWAILAELQPLSAAFLGFVNRRSALGASDGGDTRPAECDGRCADRGNLVGTWIPENGTKPMTLGATAPVNLPPRKAIALTAFTKERMRNASPVAVTWHPEWPRERAREGAR